MRPIDLAAHRALTRPLVTTAGRYDRRRIFDNARARFDAARRRGAPVTWSKAMRDAWDLAHRQMATLLPQRRAA